MKTKFALFGLLVIFAILLSACEIGITTKINADGSGTMGAKFVFTADEVSALSSMGMGSADDLCNSMGSDTTGLSGDNMDFTQETQSNGDIWCVASQTFASLDEFGQGDSSMVINRAEITDGRLYLDADLDLGQDMDTSSLAMVQGSGYDIVMYYEITAPGTIDKSKTEGFDQINGNTARMTIIDTTNKNMSMPTGSIHLALESGTSGGGSSSGSGVNTKVAGVPIWGIIVALCCCALLLVIIGVIVFFIMKRKPKQPAM